MKNILKATLNLVPSYVLFIGGLGTFLIVGMLKLYNALQDLIPS